MSSQLDELRKAVKAQGEVVKSLKKGGAKKDDPAFVAELEKLNKLKEEVAAIEVGDPEVVAALAAAKAVKDAERAFRNGLEDLMTRRFFYIPAFEIYGSVGGLYDFGPSGCAVKQNLIAAWRQHFVLTENMLEVDCSAMTPEVVLKTSGHVDKFTDFMVKDEKTGDCYRADKLLEEFCEKTLSDPKTPPSPQLREELLAVNIQAGAYNQQQLKEAFIKYNLKSPDTGNSLSDPFAFNLMFQTQIGPSGKLTGYLRPETAQGIFVNFRRLLEYNAGRMPFAAAQIGLAFRNEISPRQGLLRVREFPLAEIEHFVNPADKSHPKFNEVIQLKLQLLPRADQVTGEETARYMTVGEAVQTKTINNETLAYYMARTQLFLVHCGVKPDKVRFRQHKATEMAHYAADCWDAEIQNSYGWIECVGHADRSAYDLEVHTKVSKVELMAHETFDPPKMVEAAKVNMNNALIGKTFGKQGKDVMDFLRSLAQEANRAQAMEVAEQLKNNGKYVYQTCTGQTFEIVAGMVEITPETRKVSSQKYIPSVIEPSFGLGRILYSIFEHAYNVRPARGGQVQKEKDDKKSGDKESEVRAVLSLPAHMAPVKVAILPLSTQDVFTPIANQLAAECIRYNLSSHLNASSVSIGRRYARADEIGTPFGITIDFQSKEDNTVTIRERDSMAQIRIPINEAVSVIHSMVIGAQSWQQVSQKYPAFTSNEADD